MVLESVVPAPSVTTGKEKKPELSMPWSTRGRLLKYLHMECWSSMGGNRPASDVATVEIFPDHLDC